MQMDQVAISEAKVSMTQMARIWVSRLVDLDVIPNEIKDAIEYMTQQAIDEAKLDIDRRDAQEILKGKL